MTAFWTSFLVVALAEMGDKTQLLAFSLASRYRRPWTVMLGILLATTVNHALAASVGVWVAGRLSASTLAWVLGLGFIAFGVWTLMPDKAADRTDRRGWGPLVSTVVFFFLAEMGDKTQLATVALGARFGAPFAVTVGTTVGMLMADGFAVFIGTRLATVLPMTLIRWVASALFCALGIAAILAGTRPQ